MARDGENFGNLELLRDEGDGMDLKLLSKIRGCLGFPQTSASSVDSWMNMSVLCLTGCRGSIERSQQL